MKKYQQLIEDYYQNKTTKRSGVLLMNHINQGVKILNDIGASNEAIAAYMVHPLFQESNELKANVEHLRTFDPFIVALIIEYRATANWCLSNCVTITDVGPCHQPDYQTFLLRPPRLSPLDDVNKMLIADKVQNFKDFEIYHKDTHHRSKELSFYFKKWLFTLNIHANEYERLKALIS